MIKATVAICTAGKRPEMLERCLSSLKKVVLPYNVECNVILIMNTKEVLQESASCSDRILYLWEPKIGLSYARNKAIDYCVENKRDWLIFIDDDTWVSKDWLENLFSMQNKYDRVNIFHGHISYIKSGNSNSNLWIKEPKWPENGKDMDCACTNNVMINRDVFLRIRFDEAYNYTGGEDTDFFLRAIDNGERIIYCAHANIYEEVPKERQTFKAYIWRSYWRAAVNMYGIMRREGKAAVVERAGKVAKRLFMGIVLIVISPVCIIGGKRAAFSVAIKGINKLVFAAGSIMGLTPWRPLPYKFKEEK